jgi:5'-nucleotidase
MSQKTILVCNDDGFFSYGIQQLAMVASEFGNVIVIAPDRQQSAVGHAITIQTPLRANKVKMPNGRDAIAVTGTPADCIKLAHDKLLGDIKPDLILSGINHGSNAGINMLYSGTVSAATEGAILGYPSIAVSCTSFEEQLDMSGCEETARRLIKLVLEEGLPPYMILNANVPKGPFTELKWTRMARSRYVEEYDGRIDPYNRPYYWMTGKFEVLEQGDDLDVVAIQKGFASVTPVQYDLTDYEYLKKKIL